MRTPYLYKQKESPFWWFEFKHGGTRHRASTGTQDKREAARIAREDKTRIIREADTLAVVSSPEVSLQMGDVVLRYWEERGKFLAGAADRHTDILRIADHFGATKLITEIDDNDVKKLVQWRAAQTVTRKGKKKKPLPLISSATVNRSATVVLQAVFKHAKDEWKVQFQHEPNWKKHKLEEPRKVARVLRGNERERLDAATRADYQPLIDFAFQSSKRRDYCVNLKWENVKWAEGVIERPGKRKPDGTEKIERTAITPGIRKILESVKGHHPEFVFTYQAQRTRGGRVKGRRYPMTVNGLKSVWRRLCKDAKIENFGFHGTRRTRATAVYEATKDLVAVQKMLGHAHVTTTIRYLGLDMDDVRTAMEAADAREAALAMEKADARDAKKPRKSPIASPHSRKRKVA